MSHPRRTERTKYLNYKKCRPWPFHQIVSEISRLSALFRSPPPRLCVKIWFKPLVPQTAFILFRVFRVFRVFRGLIQQADGLVFFRLV
jgi:hypothetical protein